jgi:uncharacterized protein YdhG (YjbR/CyaY superfamily)
MPSPTSVEQYLEGLSAEARAAVESVRGLVRAAAPEARERISYGIPAFEMGSGTPLYVAGWKKHISIYPVTASLTTEMGGELAAYQTGRGTLQFPLSKPLPTELIGRIVQVRLHEESGKV